MARVRSDGAPGLIAAIEQDFPKALHQRSLIHRARNIVAKIPAGMQAELKDTYWKIFDTEGPAVRARPQARRAR
jgi:putative transposase